MDLNDLDWEDRERVLRLLFSKMNAGVPANIPSSMHSNDNEDIRGIGMEHIPAIGYDEEQ